MLINITSKGDFKKTQDYLNRMAKQDYMALLNRYGQIGVNALQNATPVDSGLTARSWWYDIQKKNKKYYLVWHNSHTETGAPVAVLIQYGHGTGTGGWVEGRDYINPAIQPLFDQIAAEVWREVTRG